MSRSYKRAIYKDSGWIKSYWKTIRAEWKRELKKNYYKEDFELRNQRSIINDYDYCDWIIRAEVYDDFWWFKNSFIRNKRVYSWK